MSEEHPRRVKIAGGREELEKVASMAAEKTAAMISRGLLEEIRRIRETLERMEAEIAAIKSMLEERGVARSGKRDVRSGIMEELSEKGFLVVGEASRRYKVAPDVVVDMGARVGAVVVSVGSDAILMSRSAMEEFKSLLRSTRSSDPREAVEAMGKYARVFEMLSKAGMVYYDSRVKGWVMVE